MALREGALGKPVELEIDGRFEMMGDPLSLERMVQNLVENALRYGGNARLAIERESSHIVLTVCDDGPGFPKMDLRSLLKPYVRSDSSRNSQSGGSGLGLAIVAQVVEQHSGRISLMNHPLHGGACVVIRFDAGPANFGQAE